MKRKLWLVVVTAGLCFALNAANAEEITLTDTPVKITATVQTQDESGIHARIAVHNGPVSQLVNTTLAGATLANAGEALRHQLKWIEPYLLVHASCNINSVRACEGDALFKVVKNKVIRLGDFIETDTPVLNKGRFYDNYDKLGEQIEFTIVMVDVNDTLQVDAEATWVHNIDNWTTRSKYIADAIPNRDWGDEQWKRYINAIVNNAALERYCNQSEVLDQLLALVNPRLDIEHRRELTDTLSKVIPLENPKAWRAPF